MELIDFILNVDVYLESIIANYGTLTYGILFAIIFAETGLVFVPFLPGDSLLFAAGMFSAVGSFDVIILAGVLWVASFLGDTLNYWIGYYFGQKIVKNKYIPINQEHIDKTQDFYKKHGGKTILLARFIPIIRTFAPFVAGIGKMNYKSFVFCNIGGGFLWVVGFVFAGYFFGNIPLVRDNFSKVILIIIFVSVLPILVEVTRDRLRENKKIKP
jgi:membrane-associated protein